MCISVDSTSYSVRTWDLTCMEFTEFGKKQQLVIGSEEKSIQAKNPTDRVIEWDFKHGEN